MDTAAIRIPSELSPEAPVGRLGLPAPGDPPRLWLVNAARHADFAARLAPAVLDPLELRSAAAFRADADRDCYRAAHVGLRLLLGGYLGTAPEEVRLIREKCPSCGGPHGRPAVAGGAVHFSLSHSGSFALLAFAATPVGVDVETVPSADAVADVASVMHRVEIAELGALAPAERPAAFARAWVRKEAYLKGLGIGLGRDPSEDYVGTGDVPAAGLAGWSIADVAVGPDRAAAVAVADVRDAAAGAV
ncbi:4'-phosphopantetheinyl transferase superfamily protein [Streptomyces sp. H10-C2]|uniref:4'-phosphopantetheinyl transferase family protein n=1 Tax=unclassified Streptomyces TaxID=2593676 RepID=UPI0024BBAF71|nr:MULTISPECIES: 4'-phosphopantetheinyl transferase superfamily protein [unclassified Streptomyces]MDJ0346849.1 4'-phosphopantetheinyl transferase superfamily protein [Streptomyces sp. PH10-H1]MDJ0372853.1 4'-phosphopantetheinyl transferase superfamily protein [Streptomyces sp. H10-C2]